LAEVANENIENNLRVAQNKMSRFYLCNISGFSGMYAQKHTKFAYHYLDI